MRNPVKTLYYECDDCEGTGLYSGMCEREGHAVVCLGCDGTGRSAFRYRPFTGRRYIRNIRTVSLSNGRSILSHRGISEPYKVSYQDFLKGKLKYEAVK